MGFVINWQWRAMLCVIARVKSLSLVDWFFWSLLLTCLLKASLLNKWRFGFCVLGHFNLIFDITHNLHRLSMPVASRTFTAVCPEQFRAVGSLQRRSQGEIQALKFQDFFKSYSITHLFHCLFWKVHPKVLVPVALFGPRRCCCVTEVSAGIRLGLEAPQQSIYSYLFIFWCSVAPSHLAVNLSVPGAVISFN